MNLRFLTPGVTALLCSCQARITCNLHELVAPPDARVAMVDGFFPGRTIDLGWEERHDHAYSTDNLVPYLYEWNNVLYQKRLIQYAVANRPIIRRDDAPEAPALSIEEHIKQFTIDKSIPTEIWMQPVTTDKTATPDNAKYVCIPAAQFDFKRAEKVKTPTDFRALCALPLKDKTGTESALRMAASIPLELVDGVASLGFNAAESALRIAAEIISLPIDPLINCTQQQRQ